MILELDEAAEEEEEQNEKIMLHQRHRVQQKRNYQDFQNCLKKQRKLK